MLNAPRKDHVWPVFDEEMVEAAARVLRSGQVNYWTGVEGRSFEADMAQILGVQHTLALTNGTSALELGRDREFDWRCWIGLAGIYSNIGRSFTT